jgi:uncharacterized protein HemX
LLIDPVPGRAQNRQKVFAQHLSCAKTFWRVYFDAAGEGAAAGLAVVDDLAVADDEAEDVL